MTNESETLPFDALAVKTIRDQVAGSVLLPGEAGYDEACLNWEVITFKQRPAIVVLPISTADVRICVSFAREHQPPLAIQGGGHGHPFEMHELEREHAEPSPAKGLPWLRHFLPPTLI